MGSLLKMIPLIWKFPKSNIFECMVLHYFFLKFNGYACFTIVGEMETGEIRTSIFDRFVFLFHTTLACGLLMASLMFVSPASNMSPLMIVGGKLIWFTCYIATLFGIVWNFLHRSKVWSLYTSVYNVDKLLLSLGAKMYYTETYIVIIVFSAIAMGFLSILDYVQFRDGKASIVDFLTMSYSNLSLTMLLTIFCIAGCLILFRLWTLNRLLEDNLIQTGNPKILPVLEKDSVRTIQKYMQIYDQLCDLTDTVNFCYSGQVMIAVAGSFVFLLFFLFGVVLFVKRNDPILDFPATTVMWSLFYFVNVILVVLMGSFLSRTGKITGNLIDQAIISSKNAEGTEMLHLFLMQLGHRSPELTCGLFPFDWTLVYSMVASSTTYLLILIQFENSR
ncbi:putative gustatory receptor 28a [Wyeomyia smithii]|uniref:putative gustatory receptor 28a n=1 Tax=Wyeomyia smithii TaxID=174621 RepID=UPI002467E91F|nr:putative gustatory receptor 28a [Wyeomyia smithii]